jgi:hypothetical protein
MRCRLLNGKCEHVFVAGACCTLRTAEPTALRQTGRRDRPVDKDAHKNVATDARHGLDASSGERK